ncbi:hypothetical protein BATDEDRAFT_89034 [Batrachochytrium dendrobatidis JAM81]|uniref:CYTH domain-containing protein n=2 Tax=Batrachochytrium dendrobatidis TaxID=109871 RepID=F4P4J8_BATDJ|nr:uncharacterized protein BATDEDRAFT_89034 [Batrachochytrium dendrobatidis JAM81]EGF79855.1 hypothetical protein BATDEDRAFT_89034 [Batrachochytrium dendrobatidis JAM81]KAJ8322564.1 hypothetical protein O5D80_008670 [Batrachochytrium dendrobatidis]KAK5673554.1 hypothetical protein QVD99_000996 [Batrachochytrium dendrobatidis]OAJ38681.1 CYTH domain-containing protein [Batrachochytrium dendrobatidis JEL423]|eukprot:XP_006679705.1 hypothetical protein BATDEDRAFT_89034 [Batrachochytrium dendrobatidis JAM81]
MEIELKLRLESKQVHTAVIDLFHELSSEATFLGTDSQENYFLDGPSRDFEKIRRTFRLRRNQRWDPVSDTKTPKSVVTLKGKGRINSGVSINEELEEPIQDELLDQLVENPSMFPQLAHKHKLFQVVFDEHPEATALQVIGSFKTLRTMFEWKNLKLEIDETTYAFGTAFEIEVETEDFQRAKDLLLPFLTSKGIAYGYSQRSKFANMKFGSIL